MLQREAQSPLNEQRPGRVERSGEHLSATQRGSSLPREGQCPFLLGRGTGDSFGGYGRDARYEHKRGLRLLNGLAP